MNVKDLNTKQQWTIASVITTIAVIVGLWTSLDLWAKIGWETPNAHDRDIVRLGEEIRTEIETTQSDARICSWWSKELTELYDQVNSGNASRRLADQIERHREKMDVRLCDRFGSY